jgi:hypothetical protein
VTPILAAIFPAFIVQVGDRLVSRRDARIYSEHDPQSNKQLVYAARDGIGLLGYSGAAYVGSTPTDHFLADALSGVSMRWRDDRLGTLTGGPDASPLEPALRRLHDAVVGAPVVGAMWVDIVGSYTRGRRRGPFVTSIERSLNGDVQRLDTWQIDRVAMSIVPPTRMNRQQANAAMAPLQSRELSPGDVQSRLIEVIRDQADADPDATIGRHCLAISMTADAPDTVRIEYVPDGPPAQAALRRRDGSRSLGPFASTVTPWVIAGGVVQPPQVVIGSGPIIVGGLRVELVGPEPGPGAPLFAMGSMRREPPPRRR